MALSSRQFWCITRESDSCSAAGRRPLHVLTYHEQLSVAKVVTSAFEA